MEENKKLDIEMSLYDVNKAQVANLKPLTKKDFRQRCMTFGEEIFNTKEYWMLLCRERNDYTIFNFQYSLPNSINALYETLINRGKVIDFFKLPDNNYEIWIRDIDTEENFVYYLFNYSMGVVEV